MKSTTQVIRPVRRTDLDEFGQSGIGTVRGLAVEVNGEVLGVCGLMYTSPMQAFSHIKPDLKQYPRLILRTARALADILDNCNSTVFAFADEDHATSQAFLSHIGFEHVTERVYKWHRQQPR
ncbi:hypothetical protein [Litorivivens sp.]|uniref:hypothetical protein n=1 Tax=Litorivivens sp. TaxID=2020868 RepID=UPI003564AAEF